MKNLIAANWKMNKTNSEALEFVKELKDNVKDAKADVLICPPFTALKEVCDELKGSNVMVGAQNMYFEESGAYTGDISPLMLKEIGCTYVILGHSERREFFLEDDEMINKKVISAFKHGLRPILCIGELHQERKEGKTNEVLKRQLEIGLKDISKEQVLSMEVAYEPVWAISRGDPNVKAATPQDADAAHKFIREVLAKLYDEDTSKNVRLLYGGSMKPANCVELLALEDVNGGLIGGASLKVDSFTELVKAG